MPTRNPSVRRAVAGVAAVLIGAVGATLSGCGSRAGGDAADAPTVFSIEGMTCDACVNTLTTAIGDVPGVTSVTVSLDDRQAVVTGEFSEEAVIAAVEKAGYTVRLAAAEPAASGPQKAPAAKRGVLVNITSGMDDLHAVSMALGLAQHARDDGREAAVFLNVAAPVFAAADLPQDVQYADFPPVGKMLGDFIASGGRVYACRHCSHVCGVETGALLEGVLVAGHTDLFPELDTGMAVFSY